MKFSRTKLSIGAVVALGIVLMTSYMRSTAVAKSEAMSNPAPATTTATTLAAPSPAAAPSVAQSDSKLTVERVTIFPYGFEPEELTVHPVPFLLTIDDRAGTDDFAFQLVTQQNQPVLQTAIASGSSSTHKQLTLAPGKYSLKETSHPDWVCTITVLAN